MKGVTVHLGVVFIIGVLLGILLSKFLSKRTRSEGFYGNDPTATCDACGKPAPCGCPAPRPRCPPCPPCREPDLSKYVLKSTIPPCPTCPDMSNYMLKTECPPVPDLSKYVLKSSIPKPQPVILDCSKCSKPKGECPPCPRPRCPEVKCPPPTKCDPPAPCPRVTCPTPTIKCKAEEPTQNIRPFLAPLSTMGFGLA